MNNLISIHISSTSILLIISVLYIFLKKLPTLLNRLYGALIADAYLMVVVDTAAINMIVRDNGEVGAIANIFNILCFSTTIIFVVISLFIIYFNLCARRGANNRICIALIAPVPFFIVGIAMSPAVFTQGTFGYFLVSGPRPLIAQIAGTFYLLLSTILVITQKKKASRSVFLAFLTIVCVEIGTGVFQIITHNSNLVSLSVALVTLVFFFTLENPNMSLNANFQIFNRQGLIELLQHLFSIRKSFGVITVQFEDYRRICANYGVREADKYIASVAEKIQKIHLATVFSTKSSELTVIIRADRSKLVEHAYNISFALNQGCMISGAAVQSRYHICVFNCPEDAATIDSVFDTIEYMLNQARAGGKESSVLVYDQQLIASQRRQEEIQNLLTEAIESDGLMVYFQPVYDAKTRRIVSAEALVRLKQSPFGYISPEEFIPIAERTGLILKLGVTVFDKVCKFIRENNLDKTSLKFIEVNLSGVQCMQYDLPDILISVMEKYSIAPSFINLEITETVAMQSSEILTVNMNRLIEYGVTFSLDDFGSGYSNVLYITNFPFSIIKLDKNLIWSYFDNKNGKSKTVLEANIEMLKKLNLSIIAEGVETLEQTDALAEIGVDSLQGFYFSKPIEESLFLLALNNDSMQTQNV